MECSPSSSARLAVQLCHSGDPPLLLEQMLYIFRGELKLKNLFWFLVLPGKCTTKQDRESGAFRARCLSQAEQHLRPGPYSFVHFVQSTTAKDSSSCAHAEEQSPLLNQQKYRIAQAAAIPALLPCYMLAMSSGSTVIMNVPKVSLTSSLCPASIFLCSKAFRLICTGVSPPTISVPLVLMF